MSIDIDDTPAVAKKEKKGKQKKSKPSEQHRELIDWIVSRRLGEWDEEAGRLNTHTAALLEAVEALGLKGDFKTIATGKELPGDRNCYCYPKPEGAWLVVRHGKKGTVVKEADTWWQSQDGYTVCLLNKAEKKGDAIGAIVALAHRSYRFFHFEDDAYVEVERRGHPEVLLIGEDTFRRLLRILVTKHLKIVALNEWLKNAIDQLAAHALEEAPEYPVFVRLAEHDGNVYLDVCDRERTVIEVDGDGWRVCATPPVRFIRTKTMLPLKMPVKGGTIADLKPFFSIEEDDLLLLVGVLVGFLNPDGPYPVLQLIGGDGRGKTFFALLILLLLDATKVVGCAPPAKVEDLMLAAKQRRILFFDNLSDIVKWLSDALCRLSTGGAIERRTLYRNSETSAFVAKRPIVVTGIRDVIDSPDLTSRAIKIDLPKIENRGREKDLLKAFEEARPKILGWLLDGVSSALKRQRNIKIDDLPRLADFCVWATAAEPGLGLEQGSIVAAYREARKAAVSELLSGGFAQAVLTLADKGFDGSGKELMDALRKQGTGTPSKDGTGTEDSAFVKELKGGGFRGTDDEIKEYVGRLRDLVSTLEAQGVSIRFRRSKGKKLITIKKT
jgi:hypothetical protein